MPYKEDSKAFSIRLPNTLIAEVEKLAGDECRNRTNMIHLLISEALAARKAAHAANNGQGARS